MQKVAGSLSAKLYLSLAAIAWSHEREKYQYFLIHVIKHFKILALPQWQYHITNPYSRRLDDKPLTWPRIKRKLVCLGKQRFLVSVESGEFVWLDLLLYVPFKLFMFSFINSVVPCNIFLFELGPYLLCLCVCCCRDQKVIDWGSHACPDVTTKIFSSPQKIQTSLVTG